MLGEVRVRILIGVVCIVFGASGWLTQTISWFSPSLARRLGFQEKEYGTDPVFRTAETYTAGWDSLVLWLPAVAGLLMILDSAWWPALALVSGGILLDAAGREAAKYCALRRSGVRTGSPADTYRAAVAYLSMAIVGSTMIACSMWRIASSF